MKKNTLVKLLIAISLLTFSCNAEAQGFLKKLSKAVDKGLNAVDKGLDAADKGLDAADKALNATSTTSSDSTKKIKWEAIPIYKPQKISIVDTNGQPVINEDGTQKFRMVLVDQFGKERSQTAVKEQNKKLWSAVGAIAGKVGIGAIAGGALKGDLKGAAVGAATGALASADDIKMAVAMKKTLKQQKKLLEQMGKDFNEEGEPKDAKVDTSSYKDYGLTEDNTVSKTAEELKTLIDSPEYNSTDDSAWEF